MFRSFLLITFMLTIITSTGESHAIINLQPNDEKYFVRITHIEPQQAKLLHTEQTNIAARFFSDSKTITSFNGNVLFSHGKLIKFDHGQATAVPLPKEDLDNFEYDTVMSGDGEWLIYKTQNDIEEINTDSMIHFINIDSGDIEYNYPFQRLIGGLRTNFDGSSLLFSSVFDNNKKIFELRIESDQLSHDFAADFWSGALFYAYHGNRIFGRTSQNDQDVYSYVNRVDASWSQPIVLNIPEIGIKIENYSIYDIANDGNTLLISHENFGLAVVHKEEGEWQVPQPLGYQPDPRNRDKFQISENGKVVAVQSFKKVVADVNFFYDALLFLKNDSGDWVKHQANSPEVDVIQDIHLTDDGTKLFWLPKQESSVPMGLNLR